MTQKQSSDQNIEWVYEGTQSALGMLAQVQSLMNEYVNHIPDKDGRSICMVNMVEAGLEVAIDKLQQNSILIESFVEDCNKEGACEN